MFVGAGGTKRGTRAGSFLGHLRRVVSSRFELDRMDAREMEAIARELKLSKAELSPLTFKSSGSLRPLSQRLSHAGLSEGELVADHGDVLRDLRRVCSQCAAKRRCERDLKHERRATPAKYCPNEQTLRALADEVHRREPQILRFPESRN